MGKKYVDFEFYQRKDISLKAKGLYAYMSIFPKETRFTKYGVIRVSKDGINSVRTAWRELEEAGYLQDGYLIK
ncbi:hypothetical protein [Lactococcus lactis]|uniref:Uncharacterized protein n=1 Tax=Lactococcus lactis TaxID=1358 RepID=A0AAW5TQZ1_9LACT|nr:hypothetical protein [Lactococcus lactis]MCW2281188.1 hypothetical protein [Lactococcus lactis]